MMLPKISQAVGENVHREAIRRDKVEYIHNMAKGLADENPVLSVIVHSLSKSLADSDKDKYSEIYAGFITLLCVINTQMEVDDLKKSWN